MDADSTKKNPKTTKRKASDDINNTHLKRHATESEKVVVYFVQGIPPAPDAKCIVESASNGVLVGFSGQQISELLVRNFIDPYSHIDENEASRLMAKWRDSSVSIPLDMNGVYDATTGQPEIPPETMLADARIEKKIKKMFICRDFPTEGVFPGAAIIIANNVTEAAAQMAKYIKQESGNVDNRPPEVKKRSGKVGDILEVDFAIPAFHRLSNGAAYNISKKH
jgi:hypothetical protein